MTSAFQRMANLDLWKDRRGQDTVEYALMAGFVALIVGALVPGVAGSLDTVLGKVNSVMMSAAANPVSHLI